MSTYYIAGCKGEEPEVVFFDKIFVTAMSLVDLDDKLQQEIEYHLIAEENLNEDLDDYSDDTSIVENCYKSLVEFIDTEKKNINEIEVFEDNNKLQLAIIELFDTYYKELTTSIPLLINLIKSEDISDTGTEQLNSIYPSLQSNLDMALNKFYVTVEEYAYKYNIDLS